MCIVQWRKKIIMYHNSDPKPLPKPKKPYAGLNRSAIKRKPKGNTDQLDFMMKIFEERGGCCEITGESLEFTPMCAHHILSKKTYTRWKLEPKNLIIILPEIHYLYHTASKEYVLSLYPNARILYDKLEELRIEYNSKSPT